jgi:SAM-dependent methyltransferase
LRFNDNADMYRLARPGYPHQVYDLLATECGLAEGTQVLEIGPGTGQATRDLLARGAHVVAVEPGADLAAHLAADLGGPRLEIVRGDLETAPLRAGSVDLAVAASSFHWVKTAAVMPRLALALRPGGWLAVWWTVFGDPENVTGFRWALDEIYQVYLPDARHDLTGAWGPMVPESWSAELEKGGWFGVEQVHFIRWTYALTAERARRLFSTFSNVMALDETTRTAFLDEIAGLVDQSGGVVTDPFVTVVYLARPVVHEDGAQPRTAPTTAAAPSGPSVIV